MTFEAMPAAEGAPLASPDPAAPVGSTAARPATPILDPRALQILSTEHWSLLTARSLAYNEAFSRAGMFLSFLSATLIVIGLMVASDAFAGAVVPVSALLLAVDLFIGLVTVGRLVSASSEEFRAIRGMNRIRHAYSEMVPGIERYFVTSIHDDYLGVLSNFGTPGRGPWLGVIHGLTTAIGMLLTIVCVLFGSLLALIAAGLGTGPSAAIGIGLTGSLILFVSGAAIGARVGTAVVTEPDALFPTPPSADPEA